MKPRALVLLLLVAASCSSTDPWLDRRQPSRDGGVPVLVGTLIDGDGHPLPRVGSCLNIWSETGVVGGWDVVTDHEGRFRIELPAEFLAASPEKRTVGLVAGDAISLFDARRAFSPGVHDIGELLFADRADARALVHLSEDRLLSRLGLVQHWSSDMFDACLRECARRGGQRILDHLEQRERSDGRGTDLTVVTARNRAARLADPLVLELADDLNAPIACTLGELPEVRLAFVNRDPLQRTLRVQCTEPECHDLSLAVDCRAMEPGKVGFHLLRPSHEGRWPGGKLYELAPLEEAVVPVRLSHYLRIEAPGRYELRLAFRAGWFWWPDDEELLQLPRGVMFLYSKPFVLDVSAVRPAPR